jgi:hypothetical protein
MPRHSVVSWIAPAKRVVIHAPSEGVPGSSTRVSPLRSTRIDETEKLKMSRSDELRKDSISVAPAQSPDWLQRMQQDYQKTGCYRTPDVRRVIGAPNYTTSGPTRFRARNGLDWGARASVGMILKFEKNFLDRKALRGLDVGRRL